MESQLALAKVEEQRRQQIEKTLFDFDDDIDALSDVSERYKAAQEPAEVEDLNSK